MSYAKSSSSSEELVDQYSSEELPFSKFKRAWKSIASSCSTAICCFGFDPPKSDHRVFLRAALFAAAAASFAAFAAFAFAAFSALAFSFAARSFAFSAGVFELHSHPPYFFWVFEPALDEFCAAGGGGAQGLSSAEASPSSRAITAPATAFATKPAAAAWFASTSSTTPIASSLATSRTRSSRAWRHIASLRGPALLSHSCFSNASFSFVGRSASTSATAPQISSASSRHIRSTVTVATSRSSSVRLFPYSAKSRATENIGGASRDRERSSFSPSRSSFS